MEGEPPMEGVWGFMQGQTGTTLLYPHIHNNVLKSLTFMYWIQGLKLFSYSMKKMW